MYVYVCMSVLRNLRPSAIHTNRRETDAALVDKLDIHRHVSTSETSTIVHASAQSLMNRVEARHDTNRSRRVWAQALLRWVIGEFAIVFCARVKGRPPPLRFVLPCLHGSGASVSIPDSRVLRNYYCLQEKTVACLLLRSPCSGPRLPNPDLSCNGS